MANCAKYTRGACGHLCKHYERAKDESGEYIKFNNQEIDPLRTHLNYNLAPERDMSQGEFIRTRCGEVRCLKRKDVNVMCSWVVTAPKNLPDTEHEEFFAKTYEFLSKRYGEENVISAHVHMDEVTPHMHFAFVPVTYDPKRECYKVSAVDVICRSELKQFHGQLQGFLEQEMGRPVHILNEATVEGNKSIEELKRGTAIKELQEVKEQLQNAHGERQTLQAELNNLSGRILSLREIEKIVVKKPLFGSERSIVELPYKDAIDLKETAKFVEDAHEKAYQANMVLRQRDEIIRKAQLVSDEAERQLQQARQIRVDVEAKANAAAKQIIDAAKRESVSLDTVKQISTLKSQVHNLHLELQEYDNIKKRFPEIGAAIERANSIIKAENHNHDRQR